MKGKKKMHLHETALIFFYLNARNGGNDQFDRGRDFIILKIKQNNPIKDT